MKKLIEFIDRNCIETQLYWVVPQLYTAKEIEVQWRRSLELPWRFREKGNQFWQQCTSKNLTEALNSKKVDLSRLQLHISQSVMQQVVFARKIVEDGTTLFGQDKIAEAVEENNRFLQELHNAILELTKDKTQPKIKSTTSDDINKVLKNTPSAALKLVKLQADK